MMLATLPHARSLGAASIAPMAARALWAASAPAVRRPARALCTSAAAAGKSSHALTPPWTDRASPEKGTFKRRIQDKTAAPGYASRDRRSIQDRTNDRFKQRGSSNFNSKKGPQNRAPPGWVSKAAQIPPPDFGPTQLLTAQEVVGKFQEALPSFSENRYVHDSLAAYGLDDKVAHLLSSYLKLPALCKTGDHQELRNLLHHWASKMDSAFKDARHSGQALDELLAEGWDIEGMRTTLVLENPLGVTDRHLTNKFLLWAERALHTMSTSETVPQDDRTVSFNAFVQMQNVRSAVDYQVPMAQYPTTRRMTRQIHLHVGPTNSGKTHGALVRLMHARTGLYAGPLRLLAHEIWYRINAGQVAPGLGSRPCNLLTGDEVRTGEGLVGLTSCTVEMLPPELPIEVAVIDEIQMIADPSRGQAWTNALLGVAAKEVHLCGEASVVPLVQQIGKACGDVVHVHEYKRLTPLEVSDEALDGDYTKISKGDCIVVFSRLAIFAIKRKVEEQTGLRCAVVYGGLPPETRAEQARLFNDPNAGYDVMIASDAIGMGLNLKIKRIVFASLTKYDGVEGQKYMTASQIKQIAGRAGRYGVHADDTVGCATTMEQKDIPVLKMAMEAPIQPITRAAYSPSQEALVKLSELIDAPDSPHGRTIEETQQMQQDNKGQGRVSQKTHDLINSTEGMGRSLVALRKDARMLVQLDEQLYFQSNISGQLKLLSIIERASTFRSTRDSAFRTNARAEVDSSGSGKDLPVGADSGQTLSISERERLADAPANTRDGRVMYALESFTRIFCTGSLVEFEQSIAASGMIQTLEKMEAIEADAAEKAKAHAEQEALDPANQTVEANPLTDLPPSWRGHDSTPSSASGTESDQPSAMSYGRSRNAAHFVDIDAPEIHIDSLTMLESLHRTCGLYLWLSYRFPLSFCFGHLVEQYKHRTEMLIQFTLEAIRIARAKRLERIYELRTSVADASKSGDLDSEPERFIS